MTPPHIHINGELLTPQRCCYVRLTKERSAASRWVIKRSTSGGHAPADSWLAERINPLRHWLCPVLCAHAMSWGYFHVFHMNLIRINLLWFHLDCIYQHRVEMYNTQYHFSTDTTESHIESGFGICLLFYTCHKVCCTSISHWVTIATKRYASVVYKLVCGEPTEATEWLVGGLQKKEELKCKFKQH